LLLKLAVDDAAAELELQSVVRAAHLAVPDELADVAARARRLATLYGSWLGWLATAVAERRRGRAVAARGALDVALEIAPGAPVLHAEMAEVLLTQDDPSAAVEHAQSAISLEGESARGLVALGRALSAAGRRGEGRDALKRALAIEPDHAPAKELQERLTNDPAPAGWGTRLLEVLRACKR
jgi:predicted Zn-dependent protease